MHAEELRQDPRLAEAKKLLLAAVQEHQKKLTGVRPPQQDRVQGYADTLAKFSEMRGGKLWYPYLGSGLGNGALVELGDGSVKYDFISGIGVHWGHSHPALIAASFDAAAGNTIMQGHLQQNREAFEVTELLLKASKMDHCFLTSSGAMACENALKLIFQKKHPKNRLLAFEHCFMGRTLTLSQITDKPAFRDGLPLNVPVDYVPFFDPERPRESTEMALGVLRKHFARYPKQHAAMCFELIQGEGGFYPGSHEFFIALMLFLKEHEVAVLVDEVQNFGRTSSLFAFQYFGLEQYVDVVSMGKLSQVCATLFRAEFKPRPGLLSQTFTSSTSALHTAKVIINSLLNDGYLGPQGKIVQIHNHFVKRLEAIALRHPNLIRGPFGCGTMISFTPLSGEEFEVHKFLHALFHAGVIAFTAGALPTRARFLVPAGGVTFEDIDAVVDIVEKTLLTIQS